MVREIEFRGKSENKWIYSKGYKQSKETIALFNDDWEWRAIEPSTLGQYTGLKDKNGTKIFDGDIIKGITEDTNQEVFGVIRFGKYLDCNFEDSTIGFYFECNGCQYSMFNGEAQGYDLLSLVEVVGNVIDNPELLGEEND